MVVRLGSAFRAGTFVFWGNTTWGGWDSDADVVDWGGDALRPSAGLGGGDGPEPVRGTGGLTPPGLTDRFQKMMQIAPADAPKS